VTSKKEKLACKSENPLLSLLSCCYSLVPFEARMIMVDMKAFVQ